MRLRLLNGCRGASLLLAAALLWVLPVAVQAAPITYFATGGSVTVSVSTGATTLATVPGVPLAGSSFFTFDDAVPELTDIEMTVMSVGPVPLSTAYAGYDSVTVHGASLVPGAGYDGTGVALQLPGPPVDNYGFSVGPMNLFGTFSATGTNVPAIVANAFQVTNPSAVGTIFVNTVTGNIAILGVTIGVIPSPDTNIEPNPLVIKGDFFFRGVVPEPGTALLLGGGLVALLATGRRLSA